MKEASVKLHRDLHTAKQHVVCKAVLHRVCMARLQLACRVGQRPAYMAVLHRVCMARRQLACRAGQRPACMAEQHAVDKAEEQGLGGTRHSQRSAGCVIRGNQRQWQACSFSYTPFTSYFLDHRRPRSIHHQ